MSGQKKKGESAERREMNGIERLGLRVSSMINHPVAQIQRGVTIHRLDTDGDREWSEIIEILTETDGIDVTFNDDGTVKLSWGVREDDDIVLVESDIDSVASKAPF